MQSYQSRPTSCSARFKCLLYRIDRINASAIKSNWTFPFQTYTAAMPRNVSGHVQTAHWWQQLLQNSVAEGIRVDEMQVFGLPSNLNLCDFHNHFDSGISQS